MLTAVPHAAALKLTVIDVKPGEVVCKVPYAEHLIGNPDTRVVHGGVITALLDNTCGIAVGSKTALQGQIATLDLRIDYMKPATPGEDILAFAECYKVTKNIAFVARRRLSHRPQRPDRDLRRGLHARARKARRAPTRRGRRADGDHQARASPRAASPICRSSSMRFPIAAFSASRSTARGPS